MDSDRLLSTFIDLVRIDAPSGHEAAAAAYCAKALREVCSVVSFDDAGEYIGSDTGNLYALLPGTAPGSIVLTAHLDCVQPCEGIEPRIVDGVIVSDGTTILGGDDKVGVAAIIEALRCLAGSDKPHAQVKVILSIQEETGCLGAKHLTAGEFEPGEPCFVLDSDGEPGTVCLAGPYHYTFEARFVGKASHAGVAPEQGISAIEAASLSVLRMKERGLLGAVGEYCAANVGMVAGGSATNVVPGECLMGGECRAIEKADIERVQSGMDEAMRQAASELGAQVEIDWDLEYEGFCLPEDSRAVQLFRTAADELGLPFSVVKSAGGTDANMYVRRGVDPLVVSTGMRDFHSVAESLKVADLESTARLAIALAYAAAE